MFDTFLTNIRKFFQILFKRKNCTVATTYFSPAGNRTPVSRVTGGDTHHYTTEEWGAANLSFNNTNCWKWNLQYHQIDRSDMVNDYHKFYFEVRSVKLISTFDIFLRILRNSFKFRFNQKVAQSQWLLPPGEELNRSGQVTGGDTHHYTAEEWGAANLSFYNTNYWKWNLCYHQVDRWDWVNDYQKFYFRSLIGKTDINVWHFLRNFWKFIQILFKPKNCTVATTYFSPAGNRIPVSRVTGGDTRHYTTEEWGAANLSFNNTNCWKWNLHYHQIDRSDWVNDYQKFYFEVRLVKLISTFDIFLRILRNSFKFRFNQKVAQSQWLLPPGEELNPRNRVTGGHTHHYTAEEWGAANLSFNNTNYWKWNLCYHQIDRWDWVNDYQKFYFEV